MTVRRLHALVLTFTLLLVGLPALAQSTAAQPTTRPFPLHPAEGPVRVLAIGNSFSGNATSLLRPMTEAGGKTWVFAHASIGGASFERHMTGVKAFEANAEDPKGLPYKVSVGGGQTKAVSLKYLLQSQPWDFVTIQQASIQSFRSESYEPSADQLVAYVHTYAPQAKLLVHETWAYRGDHTLFADGKITQDLMFANLHQNYANLAAKIGAAGVIPVGTAFQNVRQDPRWKPSVAQNVDLSKFTQPQLPPQDHELNVGYNWSNLSNPPKIVPDRGHATQIGQFLGACVWYEVFFGDVRQNPYRPNKMSETDAALMREIAHRTVYEAMLPKMVAPRAVSPTTAPTTLPSLP